MDKKKKLMISWGLLFILTLLIVFTVILWKNGTFAPAAQIDNNNDDDDGKQIETPDNGDYSILPRAAFNNISDTILWNNNIGGTNDDTIKAAFCLDDIYVFGETLSIDKDLRGEDNNLYFAVLDSDGKLLRTKTFGGLNNTIICSKMIYSNTEKAFVFILLVNSGMENKIFCFNQKTESFSTMQFPSGYEIKEIFSIHEGFIVLSQITENSNTQIVLTSFSLTLLKKNEIRYLLQGKNVTLAKSIAVNNKIIILANIDSPAGKFYSLSEYNVSTELAIGFIKKHDFSDNSYALDLLPTNEGGYIILHKEQSASNVKLAQVVISSGFDTISNKQYSAENKNIIGGRLIPCMVFDNVNKKNILTGYYVIAYTDSVGIAAFISSSGYFNYNIKELNDIGKVVNYISLGNYTILLSTRTAYNGIDSIIITVLDARNVVLYSGKYGGENDDSAIDIFETQSGFIVVAQTNSKNGDVSNNFGAKDGWVFKFTPNLT